MKKYSFTDPDAVDKILEQAVTTAFEGVDYAKLDAAYKKWIEGLR